MTTADNGVPRLLTGPIMGHVIRFFKFGPNHIFESMNLGTSYFVR